MSTSVFSDYLTEYQSIGIGTLIYALVYTIVAGTVRRYPPTVYSLNGVWDEDAISGICNDFIIDKLLIKGWIDYYLLSLNTTDELERVLKRDFRHYLISRKTRTEKTNLYTRVKKILRSNSTFQALRENSSNGDLWGLTGWKQKQISQDPHEITVAMATVQLPILIRYRSDSQKISPLISNSDLMRLIQETFLTLDKLITLDLLFDSICNRLGVFTDEIISLDDSIGEEKDQTIADIIANPGISIETELSSRQIAVDIYERLSDRQREILTQQFELISPTLFEISERIGISKSTVSNELDVIERILRDSQVGTSEIDSVVLFLKELLVTKHITDQYN